MKKLGFLLRQKAIAALISILTVLLLYPSCSKISDRFDFDRIIIPTWNPAYAIPLVNSTIGVGDFFDEKNKFTIISNPDQTLSLVYSADSLFSAAAAEFISFPDQEFQLPQSFYLPAIPPDIYDSIRIEQSFQFMAAADGQILDSLFFDAGNFDLAIRTNLNRDLANVILVSEGIRNVITNQPFRWEASLDNPGQMQWIEVEKAINLADYKFVMNRFSGTSNLLKFEITVVVRGDNQPNLSPYELNLNGALDNMKFSKAFGYLGRYELPLIDSLRITLFDHVAGGSINIGEGSVKLNFEIDNSFGMPVLFDAEELYVRSSTDPTQTLDVYLFDAGMPNEFSINSPNISQVGQSVHTSLNFSQGNLDQAFSFMPDMLFYDFQAITNADSDTSQRNFVLNDSRIRLDAHLEYQLFGALDNVTVLDTIALDFDRNNNDLDYLLFRINMTNGFPLAAGVQVYFVDTSYHVLDSLMTDGSSYQVVAADVGPPPGYHVTQSVHKTTDITVTAASLNTITQAEFMIIKTRLTTTNEQLVKIYSDYTLSMKVGVLIGLKIFGNNN